MIRTLPTAAGVVYFSDNTQLPLQSVFSRYIGPIAKLCCKDPSIWDVRRMCLFVLLKKHLSSKFDKNVGVTPSNCVTLGCKVMENKISYDPKKFHRKWNSFPFYLPVFIQYLFNTIFLYSTLSFIEEIFKRDFFNAGNENSEFNYKKASRSKISNQRPKYINS